MIQNTFKTYLTGGREYFVYGETERTEKDFPFPESLLHLLYLDIWKLELLAPKIGHALLELHQKREAQYTLEIQAQMDKLAQAHIYFEFLRLDWKEKLTQSRCSGFSDVLDLLPHKEISQFLSDLDIIQKQILILFTKVLDIDMEKKSVRKRW